MSETIKVNIDISGGNLAIECSDAAFETVLNQIADFVPRLSSLGFGVGRRGSHNSNAQVVTPEEDIDEAAPAGKRGAKRKQAPVYKMTDLGADDEAMRAFKQLFESKKPRGQGDQILLCAFWINKTLGRETFTDDDIFTALRAAGVPKVPARIESVISNLKLESKLVGERGKYRINHIGEDFVRNDLPPTAAEA